MRHHLLSWFLPVLLLGFAGRSCLAEDLPGLALTPVPAAVAGQVVTLTAVGDVVMHIPVINSCFNPTDNTYDFTPIFADIKPVLGRADLAVGVLEAPLAGQESKYTGYPSFNSPNSIADALQWAGIDLVFIAHNHCLDRGVAGLQKTMAYLDRIGLPYVGCNLSATGKRYRIIDKKGLKLAFLSYTTTTNGIKLPAGKEWMVNLFDYQKIAADIADAKQNGADGIILALHTGTEYQRSPSPEQQKMVRRLFDLGADIVLGSHVHVIQPLELRDHIMPDSGKIKTCFAAYSLGNLLSNQRWRYSDCGLMVNLQLKKPPEGLTGLSIAESHCPLWVNHFKTDEKVYYRIKLVAEKDNQPEPDLDFDGPARMTQVWAETQELINGWTGK